MPRRSKPRVIKPLFAYTDETGNSGLKLFDPNQPYFWTGTLLTPIDLDDLDPAIHRACLSRAGVRELHGNHLGFAGIERIAGKVSTLISRYDAHFLFTRVDKSHLAATKFVDTLWDSGINMAVSNLHYGIRVNRLYFAHLIVAFLDIDDREEFWAVYETGDCKAFVRILMRLEGRIETHVDDPRSRQLLLDAIKWAMLHPEPLLEGTRSELDAPNIVALTLVVHELHRLNEETGLTVATFIHDEQQQFGKDLKMAFELSKKYGSANATHPLALMVDLKDMSTFECDFRQAKSMQSFGLQLLDVALWLTKRFTDKPDSVRGKCRELAEQIHGCSHISEFTYKAMFGEVLRGFEWLYSQPLTPEMEARGRKFLNEVESIRLEKMAGTIDSGASATAARLPGDPTTAIPK